MKYGIILRTAFLLTLSNLFMTYAWYGHLKHRERALWLVVLISWGVAFFEYCLQVPANRLGASVMTAPQLKILQEAITFAVAGVFFALYLRQMPTRYDLIAFVLVLGGVAVSLFQPMSR